MPLKGHFLLVIILKSFMLTHKEQATRVPHNVGDELQDVYFYKMLNNSTNKEGSHISETPLDRTLDKK